MIVHCKVGSQTLSLEINNDMMVIDLKELIRTELSLPLGYEIYLSRGDIGNLKDTDILVVTKRDKGDVYLPYFQTEGKRTHLSGDGFDVYGKAPKAPHPTSDFYRKYKEDNTQSPDKPRTCLVS